MGKYEDNLERIRKAMRCEPVDRVPVAPCGNAYYARSQHVLMKEYITDFDKAYYDLCIELNVIPIFHLDSNWTMNIDKFKRLEDKTYILALDSKTDIRKCREIVGPDVCILGDVPCELMSFGTSEEVKDYVTKLLEDIGPWGCIIATGRDIPSDAKPENVRAMSEAAHEFLETHPQK